MGLIQRCFGTFKYSCSVNRVSGLVFREDSWGRQSVDCVHAKSLWSCPTLCNPMDCSPPGSSVPEILQARILEWVAMPFSRGSSRPRDKTHISQVSCIGRWGLYQQRHLAVGSQCVWVMKSGAWTRYHGREEGYGLSLSNTVCLNGWLEGGTSTQGS